MSGNAPVKAVPRKSPAVGAGTTGTGMQPGGGAQDYEDMGLTFGLRMEKPVTENVSVMIDSHHGATESGEPPTAPLGRFFTWGETDYLKTMSSRAHEFRFDLPDRQLAAAPLDSSTGQSYLAAMAAAANYAWANRQTLMVLAERAVARALGIGQRDLGFRLIYDVCHNIAKIETHRVGGKDRKLCVHRKGATRALPPGDDRIPGRFRSVGQPVLVPGDMGTASYLLVGSAEGDDHPFYSSCHGAGRVLSRKAAQKRGRGRCECFT